ncbi:ABC transporter permease [Maritimibacter alkaliphilus]|uniref:ABC transporter permease n=1 Tax=Maritimibacter alkaliphilus TaxID=404236 RepID=UPI001C98A6C4|nr:ABC transporter permease [Maritimibacter alkaliphilus]MBY6090878.1 ABC transporter permease [Maritimibacter alkaliphilus]
MLGYILRRLLATIPVLFVVSVLIFMLLHLGPSDPAAVIAGDFAQPEDVEKIRIQLGLDRPLYIQFGDWILGVLQGDLGSSIYSDMQVSALMMQRIEPTLSLTITTISFAILVGVPAGTFAAWRAGSLFDRGVMMTAVMGFSLPVFVLGYVLVYLFALKAQILPVQGYKPISGGLWPWLRSLILPTLSLGMIYVALIARMTRASVIEILGNDYIRTARSKGLSTPPILIFHALKNAAIPIVTTIGVGIAMLISGVVVTETVFALPGLGRLTVDAIVRKDYPVIQAMLLVFTVAYVLINLLVDLSYSLFDPRIKYQK